MLHERKRRSVVALKSFFRSACVNFKASWYVMVLPRFGLVGSLEASCPGESQVSRSGFARGDLARDHQVGQAVNHSLASG
jgi:hypothetical protein